MALLDRLKDATKPTNSIEAVQAIPAPEPGRQEPRLGQATAAPTKVEAPSPAPAKDAPKKAPAYASEPEAISKNYYVEERGSERRYFDDYKKTALAIRADDTTINSKREDLNTIRAMLTMAESRGWSEVKVNGSAEFKREAWIEAAARGITAQGYKAGDLDRQEADRRRTERGPEAQRATPADGNEIRRTGPTQSTAEPGQTARQAQPAAAEPGLPKASPEVTATPARPVKLEVVSSQERPGEATQAGNEKGTPAQERTATPADHRKTVREAEAALSDNGKLVLAALSSNIDRRMNQLNAEGKIEMKAFAASELVKKERAEGPIVLTKEQVELATAPDRTPKQAKAPAAAEAPERAQDTPKQAPKQADTAQRTPAAAQSAERAPEAPTPAPSIVRKGPEQEAERPRRSRSR